MTTYELFDETLTLHYGFYNNGAPAIWLETEDGEEYTTVTVNLPDRKPTNGRIFVKDYSENGGMAEALLDAGIITRITARYDAGYATAGVAEAVLADEHIAAIQERQDKLLV